MVRHSLVWVFLLMVTAAGSADEGLWLFEQPPRKILQEKYGFDAAEDWLTHLRLASVRFNSGGSGSFVSADGLVMTNHHVALDAIQKLSTKDMDLVKNGFLAATAKDELKAVDEELYVLQEMEDVTARVKEAIKGLKGEKAYDARRAVIARIEEESQKKTGLQSEVVTLYQGGMFHLYRFKRYTDVRLVFAPEQAIAFFGGDADNFAYPRYCLDVSFFRVYENGKPAKIDHYLKWNDAGAKEGDLVFVSGHPGRTDRLNTVAELEYLRDKGFPYLLQRLNRWEVMATVYCGQGQEQDRKGKDFLFGVANSRKARLGGLAGLQDPALMARKRAEEKKLRAAAAKHPDLKDVADAWDIIAEVQKIRREHIRRYTVLESGAGFNTSLFGIARTLVRAAAEFPKPNEKRLEGFTESDKKGLELRLFSKQPFYADFELAKLEDSLGWLVEQLGFEDPLVKKILEGKSPRERAGDLIAGTKLFDVAARKKLYKGGSEAIDASQDPLIRLAALVDPEARKVRKIMQAEVEEPKRQAYDKIARAKFAVEGTDTYPDATFTLRLSFGTVKGYQEAGTKIPFETTMAGAFEKAAANGNKAPFDLPASWLKKKGKIAGKTPFNFVCTPDIIGGNSGSPVVDRQGRVVGLIFDGNVQSLVWDFVYTDEVARSVAVCAPAITEALRSVYGAGALAKELIDGKR